MLIKQKGGNRWLSWIGLFGTILITDVLLHRYTALNAIPIGAIAVGCGVLVASIIATFTDASLVEHSTKRSATESPVVADPAIPQVD